MIATLAVAAPVFDWHALAPEIILVATIAAVLVADLIVPDRDGLQSSRIATVGVLGALIPVITLAYSGHDRSMFGGAFVVDHYAIALAGFFLLATYVTILLSVDYISEGDYYKSEYYVLLLTSAFGMVMMVSARDLITLFVALETISIPTFILAAFRKHDRASNEAGVKYYLIGVLSSALMLYGMSLIFGITGSTKLSEIGVYVGTHGTTSLLTVAVFLSLIGFAFKVSAVPFHFWAPDTYEGAPTPVTAFLSVASKAGGFVALINIVYFGFYGSNGSGAHAWWGAVWLLAALSMTFGNLAALRQTNIVRMLAYSSIAQGGFMLVPFAAAGIAGAEGKVGVAAQSMSAVVIYLLIYGAMNLGAFAVVIAVARRTHSAEISSYSGLWTTSPTLAVTMTLFMASLAGIPPLAGWFAKFVMFRSIIAAGGGWGISLAVIAAINSVIAFFYYFAVVRRMWFDEPAEADTTPIRVPTALGRCHCDDGRGRRDHRHLSGAVRQDRGAGVLAGTAADAIVRRIRREGPITFDQFVEVALYEPEVGFFAAGRGAGRAGRDFVTSPEVGSLFGACVARALDDCWHELGDPDPFVVVEAGAGNGRLARDVQRARPECSRALHYVLVEVSGALRDEQRERLQLEPPDEALGPFARAGHDEDAPQPVSGSGPVFVSLDELPALEVTGVVVANELLDNLPFGIAEWSDAGWTEVRIALTPAGGFAEVVVPAEPGDARALDAITDGVVVPVHARLPIPRGIDGWLEACGQMLRHGTLIAIDYVDDARGLLARGPSSWMRTYREHERGGLPLEAPGAQDITADVAREQLLHAARRGGLRVRCRSVAGGVARRPRDRGARRSGPPHLGGTRAHR